MRRRCGAHQALAPRDRPPPLPRTLALSRSRTRTRTRSLSRTRTPHPSPSASAAAAPRTPRPDPRPDFHQAELLENIFNCLCTALLQPANQHLFLKAEGIELMVRILTLTLKP